MLLPTCSQLAKKCGIQREKTSQEQEFGKLVGGGKASTIVWRRYKKHVVEITFDKTT